MEELVSKTRMIRNRRTSGSNKNKSEFINFKNTNVLTKTELENNISDGNKVTKWNISML